MRPSHNVVRSTINPDGAEAHYDPRALVMARIAKLTHVSSTKWIKDVKETLRLLNDDPR